MNKSNSTRIKTFIGLHGLLMLYSMRGICSKRASMTEGINLEFAIYYSIIIVLLGVYAIGWQQVIKRLPLTTAFANKAITIIWGIVWGKVFFGEAVTVGKIIGAGVVMLGVILYSLADSKENHDRS